MDNNRFNKTYRNYTEAEDQKVVNVRRWVLIGGAVFAIAVIAAGVSLIYKGPAQSAENELPQLEFAGDNSKIAGIQPLVSHGLSFDEYSYVHRRLKAIMSELEPEAEWFNAIGSSFELVYEDLENGKFLINDTSVSGEAEETEIDESEEIVDEFEEAREDVFIDAIQFELVSSAGNKYKVEISLSDSYDDDYDFEPDVIVTKE